MSKHGLFQPQVAKENAPEEAPPEEAAKPFSITNQIARTNPVMAVSLVLDDGLRVILPWAYFLEAQHKDNDIVFFFSKWKFTLRVDVEKAAGKWNIYEMLDAVSDQTLVLLKHAPEQGLSLRGEVVEDEEQGG